jgi:hypothetical protein
MRKFWADVAAKLKVPDPASAHYFRVSSLFDAAATLDVGGVAVRRCDPSDAGRLAEVVRARSMFTRGRNDLYAWRASQFAGKTLLQAALDPATDATEAREVADRAERLVFVATTYWLPRNKLHKWLSLTPQAHGEGDLFLRPELQHPSMRSPTGEAPRPIPVDEAFVKRFHRYGFNRIAPRLLRPKGFVAEKADRGLAWLREARVEVQNDAALIKTVIGLEALFVQERGEPLAHTISERLAFLLGRDPGQRAALYRVGKRLYEARSNVVHSGHRERVAAETVEVATTLLLMAAEGLVENAAVLGTKDAARQFFDAMRWSSSAAPPTLPFPAGTVARVLRAAQRNK